jgi:hypothetical protein
MSIVTDIYNQIVTIVSAEIPTAKRIPNPYSVLSNPATYLRYGYGVVIGPGTNTERYVGCVASWERDYTIVIVKQVFTTEHDTQGRVDNELSLDEERSLIYKAIEKNPSLNQTCVKGVVVSDSGIEYEEAESSKFVAIALSISVEYHENL